MTDTTEIEVRFLEIDKNTLIEKLLTLGAIDKKEVLLKELIFYDNEKRFVGQRKLIRLRQTNDKILLAYKHHKKQVIGGTTEIEFTVSSLPKAKLFVEMFGFEHVRTQEKKRHTFVLDNVTIDIDSWPKIPPYVELEGKSKKALQSVAKKLGLPWKKVVIKDALAVLEENYQLPVGKLRYFTFDKIE